MNEERGIRSEERGIAAIFATSATSGKVQCGVLSGSITHAVYNTIYLSHRHQGSVWGSITHAVYNTIYLSHRHQG
jgi:hypothetical protein